MHRALAVLLAASLFLSGCGKTGDAAVASDGGEPAAGFCAGDETAQPFTLGMHESAASGVTVAIESNPPVPGPNELVTWELTITDGSGAPVPSGTPVSMVCKMSHAAGSFHGCAPTPPVNEISEGHYEATPIEFNMHGHWAVSFRVGGADEVRFELCVE